MPKIFICYRREDSNHQAGRLYDFLVSRFGASSVFKDVDSIVPGQDFRRVLDENVSQCDVLLALLGDRWLAATDAGGKRRLDNPADFVRIEIETALRRDIAVVPVLVGQAHMPHAVDLPPSLQDFAYRHGALLRPDPDFRTDVDRLIRSIANYRPKSTARVATSFSWRKTASLRLGLIRDKFASAFDFFTLARVRSPLGWASVVVALYAIALIILTVPLLTVAMGAATDTTFEKILRAFGAYGSGPYWCFIFWWMLCQTAMLLIPVRVVDRRPVTRRSRLLPLVITTLLTGLLLTTTYCSLGTFFGNKGSFSSLAGLCVFITAWVGWAVLFFRRSRRSPTTDLQSGLCHWLLSGSILELLVAVPTHVVVRNRSDCCAEVITFLGLLTGLPIMLLCFGPGVFYLFVERAKRLRPRKL